MTEYLEKAAGQAAGYVEKVQAHYMAPIELSESARPQSPLRIALYPLQGLLYFLKSPALWKILIMPIVVTFLVGVAAFVLIFGLALYPQELLFEETLGWPAWLSWILAVLLCLAEVLALIFLDGTRRRIYYKVFELEGITVVQGDRGETEGRFGEVGVAARLDDVNCCCCWIVADVVGTFEECLCCLCHPSRLVWWLCSSIFSLVLFVVTFPLNFIPVLGTLGFCMINGYFMAWRMQRKYMLRKGLNFKEQTHYVFRLRPADFLAFGTVCMLLDLIPLIDILLVYTNIVASALWAVDMEKAGTLCNYSRLPRTDSTDADPLLGRHSSHSSDEGNYAAAVTADDMEPAGPYRMTAPGLGQGLQAWEGGEEDGTQYVGDVPLATSRTADGKSVV
eukprot:CAMPEP_0114616126 /NCGR_PEP_ID=MMETSP0168-20121206/6526_1 /TAXON_ID=95228 ORGANISM="Vannella sp., Strain DIVA3 517/6/12" /NCGR_SAMPLE_ID=MMETSP0168 /ASSEMBLY_ACC=CAM_ASM_000044 /LENGTH=391 /DNA_ID=CAMNT_0001827231 /DNA_START=125 /DNA_END=1297 /DNA_ORIENTATION=-